MLQLSRSARSITARGAAAMSLLAAAYVLPSTPAAARDIEGLPAQCAQAGNELAKLKCGRRVFQEQTADAQARSVDAKNRSSDAKASSANAKASSAAAATTIAAAQSTKTCMDSVTRDIQAASKIGPLKPQQVKTFESRIAGCEGG